MDDARLDFYTVYRDKSNEYDAKRVKKYDEDFNTALVFVRHPLLTCPATSPNLLSLQAGLLSAVSSAFLIDIQSKLEPDPNEQSAALLRAILFTLNQSALPAETATVPPIHEDPPDEIVTVTGLMYASLFISLFAAFIAVLGKQWLNRYLRNTGGSMVERCWDRQRKCEGLDEWPLHLFVESLPTMFQISLLILVSGLCRHMWSINTSVARILITLTTLGFLFYIAIVAAGTSSYQCPFQTPASVILRHLRDTIGYRLFTTIHYSFSRMKRASKRWIQHHFTRPSLPIMLREVRSGSPVHREVVPQWVLVDLFRTTTYDTRCVSWILRSITDQEAIDAAIRLASTIRWFVDGFGVQPPYDMIVSTLQSCFDSSDKIYPGSMDRAYHFARAVLQIHVFAMCRSQEFAGRFPLPFINSNARGLSRDLDAIFRLYQDLYSGHTPSHQVLSPTHSPVHLQWASNLLSSLAWARHRASGTLNFDADSIQSESKFWDELPPAVVLDRLLVWCMLLGRHVDRSVLIIEGKSCVVFHLFPQKMHISFFLAVSRIQFYLNYPSQSTQRLRTPPTPSTSISLTYYEV